MNTMQGVLRLTLLCAAASFVACGGSTNTSSTTNPQVEQGMTLYAANCASCHGADGSGTSNGPAVVGEGVLPLDPPAGAARDVQFRTAGDVFRWVRVTMPGDDPGSLSDSEYAAILAFDLHANGVDLTDITIDEATADTINLR